MSALQPHQQRMLDEHADLSGRLAKLDAFIATNDAFAGLPPKEQALLRMQSAAMHCYAEILGMRIDGFSPAPR